jgi:hypothetical protein
MQDCMEHCSRYWGKGEGCFGIVWVEDGSACWIRNSNVSTSSLSPLAGNHAALVSRTQMKGLDTSCPHADMSTTNTIPGVEGLMYTMLCDKVISGQDACFEGHACLDIPYKGFYHTASFEECLQICVQQHPLCRAISWNPGLEIGFANCWHKIGFNDSSIVAPRSNQGTIHTATITQIDQIDTECPKTGTYKAGTSFDQKVNFDIYCGKSNSGTHITSPHTQNVTACMDACVASDEKKCIGVSFDSGLAGGYSNCYLMNTTAVVSDQASTTYALIADTAVSSSGSKSSASSSSGSKAWIVGPVIGGILALAALSFALFWLRRKKRKNTSATEKDGQPLSKTGYGSTPEYSPTGNAGAMHANGYYDGPGAAAEVDGWGTSEMPAPTTTKYASDQGLRSEAQELSAERL